MSKRPKELGKSAPKLRKTPPKTLSRLISRNAQAAQIEWELRGSDFDYVLDGNLEGPGKIVRALESRFVLGGTMVRLRVGTPPSSMRYGA